MKAFSRWTTTLLVAAASVSSPIWRGGDTRGGGVACASDAPNDGDPPVRRPGRRSARDACTLSLSFNLGDLGGITPMMYRNDNFDLGLQLEGVVLQHEFGVSVPMAFFDDSRSPNACYYPGACEELRRDLGLDPEIYTDRGIILLGKSLVRGEREAGRWYGVWAILGHEFAHAMQTKRNCPLTGMWRELHADLMAGWYTARTNKVVRRDHMAGFFAISDKGDYSFGSPGHHGTPEERGTAFMLGYQYKNEADASKVYRSGLEDIAYWMKSR